MGVCVLIRQMYHMVWLAFKSQYCIVWVIFILWISNVVNEGWVSLVYPLACNSLYKTTTKKKKFILYIPCLILYCVWCSGCSCPDCLGRRHMRIFNTSFMERQQEKKCLWVIGRSDRQATFVLLKLKVNYIVLACLLSFCCATNMFLSGSYVKQVYSLQMLGLGMDYKIFVHSIFF